MKRIFLVLAIPFLLSMTGCLDLAVEGAASLVQGGLDYAKQKVDENSGNDLKKEDNAHFVAGVTTEAEVKSVLNPNGGPKKELSFADTKPAKKVLIYKRDYRFGPGYRVVLLASDGNKEYRYCDDKIYTDDNFSKLKENADFSKFMAAQWYVDSLSNQLSNDENLNKNDLASQLIEQLVTQDSSYPDVNAEACNSAAWFLATCRDPRFRNADEAISLSTKAVGYARNGKDKGLTARYLDTLAAAYAEKGDFKKASDFETEAYNLALDKTSGIDINNLNSFQILSEAYKSGRTYAVTIYGPSAAGMANPPVAANNAIENSSAPKEVSK